MSQFLLHIIPTLNLTIWMMWMPINKYLLVASTFLGWHRWLQPPALSIQLPQLSSSISKNSIVHSSHSTLPSSTSVYTCCRLDIYCLCRFCQWLSQASCPLGSLVRDITLMGIKHNLGPLKCDISHRWAVAASALFFHTKTSPVCSPTRCRPLLLGHIFYSSNIPSIISILFLAKLLL